MIWQVYIQQPWRTVSSELLWDNFNSPVAIVSWPSCWVKGCKAFWHPAFLFKIAISWSTYVLQIQVKWHHNILETLRYIIDMPVITLMIVSVPTCRCVFCLYKCTHTSWGLYSPSPALFVSWASFTKRGCRQHFLCFLFGEKTNEKKKKTLTLFWRSVCFFRPVCSLSPRTAKMNPSGEPEIQG